MTSEVKITERGWPGHLIVARWCEFRRNTLLQYGDTRVVVSTVGAYVPPGKDARNYQEIGHNRHFETMAFRAKWEDPYWDADVSAEISLDCEWQLRNVERDSDQKANDMHDRAVDEIATRLANGGL